MEAGPLLFGQCRSCKEKGRPSGGLKVGSGEDPSPEYDLEEHLGM